MFPLLAISAFFILGIAFFVVGKDDFGIKRVKEVSNDTSDLNDQVLNQEPATDNVSSDDKKLVTTNNSPEKESEANTPE